MSHSIHAILWARLGDETQALRALDLAWRRNVHGPFRIWSETPGIGCVNFLTGAGGFLQALLAGLGGVQVVDGGLLAQPLKPKAWRHLAVRGLTVGAGSCELRVDAAGARVLPMAGTVPPERLRLR